MKHEDIYAAVGRRIRSERSKVGLTLEELAEASSISASFLAYVEQGKKKASLVTIQKLADGLRIPVASLFADIRAARGVYEARTLGKLMPLLKERTAKDRDFIVGVVKDISRRLKKK